MREQITNTILLQKINNLKAIISNPGIYTIDNNIIIQKIRLKKVIIKIFSNIDSSCGILNKDINCWYYQF